MGLLFPFLVALGLGWSISSGRLDLSFSAKAKKDAPLAQGFNADQIPEGPLRREILYGRDLMMKTAELLGPEGSVRRQMGTRMNCASCHLDGGAREGGLSLLDTHGLYPQYRAREGRVLSVADRINSCVRMPMQGEPLDEKSREMQALLLYIRYLGRDRPVLLQDPDQRIPQVTYPERAADPEKGRALYVQHCVACHGLDGQGRLHANKKSFEFPPLWGPESYRFGSSMHRVTIAARFIHANMPLGLATPEKPVLTVEEAFDVAAFINDERVNPRPPAPGGRPLFPHIEFKPIDFPQGPYADHFSEQQHRLGPFGPIEAHHREEQKKRQASDGDLNAP